MSLKNNCSVFWLLQICNNLNHCQCEKGFDPPTCLQKKGEFGSIDDGHKAPSGLCLSNFINQRQLCKRKKLKYRFQARLQSNWYQKHVFVLFVKFLKIQDSRSFFCTFKISTLTLKKKQKTLTFISTLTQKVYPD